MTQDELCCNIIKANSCIAELGYEIVLKCNKGYDVEKLFSKLQYLKSLRDILERALRCGDKIVKDNKIHFCNEKILLSKNNSLFLTHADECSETELSEECCTDLCEVESKLSSICINC